MILVFRVQNYFYAFNIFLKVPCVERTFFFYYFYERCYTLILSKLKLTLSTEGSIIFIGTITFKEFSTLIISEFLILIINYFNQLQLQL